MTNNTNESLAHLISTAIDIDIYDEATLADYIDDYLTVAGPALTDQRSTLIAAIDYDLRDFLDNDYLDGMIDDDTQIALTDDPDRRLAICTIIADQILANI